MFKTCWLRFVNWPVLKSHLLPCQVSVQLSNAASPLGLFHSFGPTLIWGLVQVRCQVAGREVRPSEKESPVSSCLALFISKQEHSFMSRTALPGALGLPCRGIRGQMPAPRRARWDAGWAAGTPQGEGRGPELCPGTHGEHRDQHVFLPHFPVPLAFSCLTPC